MDTFSYKLVGRTEGWAKGPKLMIRFCLLFHYTVAGYVLVMVLPPMHNISSIAGEYTMVCYFAAVSEFRVSIVE